MIVLGVDPATITGLIVWDASRNALLSSAHVDTGHRIGMDALYQDVVELVTEYGAELAGVEDNRDLARSYPWAMVAIARRAGVVIAALQSQQCRTIMVTPAQWQIAAFRGLKKKRAAERREYIATCERLFGIRFRYADEVDAFLIARAAMRMVG